MQSSFDLADFPSARAIHDADPKITPFSRWSDRIWRFEGDVPGHTPGNFVISWPECPESLMLPLKWLAARCFIGRFKQFHYKSTTTGTFSAGIRYFVRFMLDEHYTNLDKLDSEAFEEFRESLFETLMDEAEFDPDFAAEAEQCDVDDELTAEVGAAEEQLGQAQAYYRLRVWRLLWLHRSEMQEAGLPVLAFNPFTEQSPTKMAKSLATRVLNDIPPLPDEVALPILAAATRMIGAPAEDVIKLQGLYLGCLARMDREPPTAERRKIQAVLEAFPFSVVEGETAPWRQPLRLPPGQEGGGDILRELIEDVRNAALAVIMGLTGVRISEALSPKLKPRLPGDGHSLPSCISKEVSKTGLCDLFLLHGLHSKQETKARPESWLAGSRPRGSGTEPLVVNAVRVLERLYEPWRAFAGNSAAASSLMISFTARGLPRKPASVGQLTIVVVREGLREFIDRHVDLTSLDQLATDKPHLARYAQSKGQCVHPHQWRKTFLRYAMRIDSRMTAAVSQHFKHLSLVITEKEYAPSDLSLLVEADGMQLRETAAALREIITGVQPSFARIDRAIAAARDDLKRMLPDIDTASDRAFEDLAIKQDLRIWYAPHGRCLIAINPDEARCQAAAGNQGWAHRAPNPLTRTPGLCLGCANFSLSPHSIGFWRERYIANQHSWLSSGRDLAFRVAQKRAEQAAAVLKALGEPLPLVVAEEARPASRTGS